MKIILLQDVEIPEFIQQAPSGKQSSRGSLSFKSILCTFQWSKGKMQCLHNCFNSVNDANSNRPEVAQTRMQSHRLLSWCLTASSSPATPGAPERSRAAGSKAPRGRSDSKGNFKNEIRTERVVAGATCKINAHGQTQAERSRRAAAERCTQRSGATDTASKQWPP